MGLAVVAVGAFAGVVEFFSGWYVGSVCAKAIKVLPQTRGGIFINAIVLTSLPQLLGVFGMVFSIMTLSLIGLM